MQIKFYGMDPLSLVDFDGMLTCTIFTAGCNFRCPFCHNKDLVCFTNLKEIPLEEIINYLKERKNMLDAVCITGGEPTLYPDLKNVLKEFKNLGYFIKLDTNGTNPDAIKNLHQEGLIDYIAMDIKNCDEKYSETIGDVSFSIDKIHETINYLHSSNIKHEFRTTIIKEYHNLDNLLSIAKALDVKDNYFLQRFVDQGHCIKNGLHEIDERLANKYLQEIKKYLPNANLRGY